MPRHGQTLIEFVLLICVIVAALAAMQVYFKRSYQGRARGYADEIGGGFGYSPGATIIDNRTDRTITEFSRSMSEGEDAAKKSITESEVTIAQDIRRDEQTLPFSAEPRR